ncbi:MAG: hypothetical protein GC181_07135 [Bacteroidetes bacterium]|nr:hypothetical protein [Bacteroidota bacterium]
MRRILILLLLIVGSCLSSDVSSTSIPSGPKPFIFEPGKPGDKIRSQKLLLFGERGALYFAETELKKNKKKIRVHVNFKRKKKKKVKESKYAWTIYLMDRFMGVSYEETLNIRSSFGDFSRYYDDGERVYFIAQRYKKEEGFELLEVNFKRHQFRHFNLKMESETEFKDVEKVGDSLIISTTDASYFLDSSYKTLHTLKCEDLTTEYFNKKDRANALERHFIYLKEYNKTLMLEDVEMSANRKVTYARWFDEDLEHESDEVLYDGEYHLFVQNVLPLGNGDYAISGQVNYSGDYYGGVGIFYLRIEKGIPGKPVLYFAQDVEGFGLLMIRKYINRNERAEKKGRPKKYKPPVGHLHIVQSFKDGDAITFTFQMGQLYIKSGEGYSYVYCHTRYGVALKVNINGELQWSHSMRLSHSSTTFPEASASQVCGVSKDEEGNYMFSGIYNNTMMVNNYDSLGKLTTKESYNMFWKKYTFYRIRLRIMYEHDYWFAKKSVFHIHIKRRYKKKIFRKRRYLVRIVGE